MIMSSFEGGNRSSSVIIEIEVTGESSIEGKEMRHCTTQCPICVILKSSVLSPSNQFLYSFPTEMGSYLDVLEEKSSRG